MSSRRSGSLRDMSLPQIVDRETWLSARTALLEKEKAATRARDALNAERRELPMVEVEKDYTFEGPDGPATLADLFEGRSQLIVTHFMFDPSWDAGCSSCTAGADEVSDGFLRHVNARETTIAYVSRAPLPKLEDYKAERGWTFPWYSSFGSDFNYDFGVTLDPAVAPPAYNYRPLDPPDAGEVPGLSVFLRAEDRIFHSYSTFARGMEMTGGSYYFLDLTPLGRQEEWEEPKGRSAAARPAQPDFAE
ncbi:MAG: hypothetical protein JWQ18_1445 [Conexibacter sp.]|nr:hypothetical protein [Conexibacter sp.]